MTTRASAGETADQTRAAAFLAHLRAGTLLADGAMGTMLTLGMDGTGAGLLPAFLVPEQLNEAAPEQVLEVHRAYARAGAQILETNSFGGNAIKLASAGIHHAGALNTLAARLARTAAGEAAQPVWVAGSMGPTGQFLEPLGNLTFDAVRAAFAAQAAALAAGGADLLLIETMTDLHEARAALLGALEATSLPVVITFAFEAHGRTMMGLDPARAIKVLADGGAVAVGVNCGQGPDAVLPALQLMHEACPSQPLVAQPNAGQPVIDGSGVYYDVLPLEFAGQVPALLAAGVRVFGSCCGSTPVYTAALAQALAGER